MLFGEVHHDFKPKLAHKNKNFITLVRIFLLEGVGFYAHVIVSTCKSVGGYIDVHDEYYPVKINTQTKEFIVIENQGEGANRQFRFRDRLKCENIDEMIEKVMMRCIEQPEVIFEPVEMRPEDLDSADWWRQGQDDPDFWKRGKESTGPTRIVKRDVPKDDQLPDKHGDKLPTDLKVPDTWEDPKDKRPPPPPPPPMPPPKKDDDPFGNIIKI
jgi:hypothetical protein